MVKVKATMQISGKIVIFLSTITCIKSGYKTCTREKAIIGQMNCLLFRPQYQTYQWAICVSNEYLRQRTGGRDRCIGSHCWYPCTRAVGGKSRSVLPSCRCNPRHTRPIAPSIIDKSYYIPTRMDCGWYTQCTDKYVLINCPVVSNRTGMSTEQQRCQFYQRDWNTFSKRSRRYIANIENCLQRNFYYFIVAKNEQWCHQYQEKILKIHKMCLMSSPISFCDLKLSDQLRIFWIYKSFFTTAYGGNHDPVMDFILKCFDERESRRKKERTLRMKIRFTNIMTQPSIVADKITKRVKWQRTKLHWASKIAENNSEMLDLSISYNSTCSFLQKQSSHIRIYLKKSINSTEGASTTKGFDDLSVMQFIIAKRRHISFIFLGTWTITLVIDFPDKKRKTKFDQRIPGTPDEIGIQFLLFTKSNPKGYGHVLNPKHIEDIHNSTYNETRKTVFIIHGFRNDGNTSWVQKVKTALLQKFDINVIIVEWGKGAAAPLHKYPKATVNTAVVGFMTSILIQILCKYFGTQFSDIHLIGHSLGAHVAGFAGSYTNGAVGRISGLDPAGIYFEGKRKEIRLDASDAKFVDVIHTDGGEYSMGMDSPSGDVDFYPNGGKIQPGCYWPINWNIACSHERATLLFLESINSDCKFLACQCSEKEYREMKCYDAVCTEMGYRMDIQATRGKYYLDTNGYDTYCTGKLPGQSRNKREEVLKRRFSER